MTDLRRVSVITQAGKVVGVCIPPDAPADPRAPITSIVAGPRQQLHEVMVEVPAVLKRSKDIDAFHAAVRKQVKRRGRKK